MNRLQNKLNFLSAGATFIRRPAFFLSLWLALSLFPCFMNSPLQAAEASPAPTLTMEIKNKQEWVVRYGTQTLCVYTFSPEQWKPYVKELSPLQGRNVLRDSPSDHKHHHALMYGIKVNGINFWEEVNGSGVQKPLGTPFTAMGLDANKNPQATFVQTIHWLASNDVSQADSATVALLIEQRILMVSVDAAAQEVALHWHSAFELGGKTNIVTLSGANYHGLGMRFREGLDALASHMNAGGGPGLEGTKQDVSRHAWGAVCFNAPDSPITVVLAGHPNNTRGQAWFFTMAKPFAYLSATQNLDRETLVYNKGDKFALDYRVMVYPSIKQAGFIQQRVAPWQSSKP